ncbi:MAG: ribosome small subunit-dependent GTPase A [Spirochaetes bacterium]|nr:ribosome small subunit-dependent GTPase A [Spirochaetota bacterium]
MRGRVLSTANNLSKVLCEDGTTLFCGIKGKRIKSLERNYNSLAAGDWVEVRATDGGRGLVIGLEPRLNKFGRYNEKGRAEQAIAVNIDRVICVSSPAMPPFRPRFIDRLAVMAESASVFFVIVLNKVDLGLSPATEARIAGYGSLGYQVIRTSAKTGEGLASLARLLESGSSVLAGQSGVGKSSLLNALFPGLDRKTQEVSEKYERGKHTTTQAEAVLVDAERMIIDTPGIRRLALRSIDIGSLAAFFPEFKVYAEDCSFGGACCHVDEEGCVVRTAVAEGQIDADRYESYLRIREELTQPEPWRRSGPRDPGRRQRGFLPGKKRLGKVLDPFDEDEEY